MPSRAFFVFVFATASIVAFRATSSRATAFIVGGLGQPVRFIFSSSDLNFF